MLNAFPALDSPPLLIYYPIWEISHGMNLDFSSMLFSSGGTAEVGT
jgi:hypothetical protein